jgi:glycosyltransferase involved in cell wall biosynthesis
MDVGGAEVMVQSLCRTHRAQGHDVSVHCLYACGILGEQLREEGIPVTIYGPGHYPVLIARMCGAFRTVAPDVVHCHNVVASVVGAVAGRLGGARAVICTRHGIVSKPRNLRRQGLFWLAARCADRVVAVCEKAQHNLARATFAQPAKLVTIWNGAAPAPTSEGGARDTGTAAFTVVTVARLGPPKDHATLVRAVARVRDRISGLRLWIVGDGPNASTIRELAAELGCADAVHLLGSRPDVGDWLARADLFALSSLSEGVPIALLEAMAASLPSVVSDVGGMGEVVNGAKAGVVVPAGDVEGFTESIVRYASDREQRRAHGLNARDAYLRHFTLERMADGYMALYRNPRAAIQPQFARAGSPFSRQAATP